MKNYSLLLAISHIIMASATNINVHATWILPDPRLRFDQVSYLCSHNAYANKEEGFAVHQHTASLKKQLNDYGVRSLMLDTWWFNNDVYLCHGECAGKGVFKKVGGEVKKIESAESFFKTVENLDETIKGSYQALKGQFGNDLGYKKLNETLNEINDFLDKNPKEIITILLQNETSSKKIWDVIKKNNRSLKYLLTNRDWKPYEQNEGTPVGGWPTLDYLQKNNKRLIIFDSKIEGEEYGLYYQWFYTFENWYNTNERPKICQQRPESTEANTAKVLNIIIEKYKKALKKAEKKIKEGKSEPKDQQLVITSNQRISYYQTIKNNLPKKQLTVINNFKPGQSGSKANTKEAVTKLFSDCSKNFLKTYPNFLALDEVEEGNPLDYINSVNAQQAKNLK